MRRVLSTIARAPKARLPTTVTSGALTLRRMQPPARFASDIVTDDVIDSETSAVRANTEATAGKPTGESETSEFQAETRKLLDIVACSMYTDKDVFIRELISNASDAISKLKHLQSRGDIALDPEASEYPHEIVITCDERRKTVSFHDHGIGMNKEELKANLGTICRSGTQEFLRQLNQNGSPDASSIIGQFGVGFYSAFMCSKRAKVYTRSAKEGSQGYLWESDGDGRFTITPHSDVEVGTKVVLELKDAEAAYSVVSVVERTIKKYSNFVPVPIILNGRRVNTYDALWLRDAKEITAEEHRTFFRFLSGSVGDPLMHLVYKAEGPINANALFYIPRVAPQGGQAAAESNVSLYCRKVLIQPKTRLILPEWMRFIVGVVDSEDLPLNISREHTQDSPLIRRLAMTVTKKVLRWLNEEADKNPDAFRVFWEQWGPHIKSGVLHDPTNKREIAKLLRFASTSHASTSLQEYADRIPTYQRAIFYMIAPDRNTALATPYMEAFEKEGIEVLIPSSDADAFVMRHLESFQKLKLVNIESAEASRHVKQLKDAKAEVDREAGKPEKKEEDADTKEKEGATDELRKSLTADEEKLLSAWLITSLRHKIREAVPSQRLVSSPMMLADHAIASERRLQAHFMNSLPEIGPQKVEFNPSHPAVIRIFNMTTFRDDAKLQKEAVMLAEQLYDNSLLAAGLLDDPRVMLRRLTDIITALADNVAPTKPNDDFVKQFQANKGGSAV